LRSALKHSYKPCGSTSHSSASNYILVDAISHAGTHRKLLQKQTEEEEEEEDSA